jgi:dihydroorotate dehydrogenase
LFKEIAREMEAWMKDNSVQDIKSIVGAAHG